MNQRRQKGSLRARALLSQGNALLQDGGEHLSTGHEMVETFDGNDQLPSDLVRANKPLKTSDPQVGVDVRPSYQTLGSAPNPRWPPSLKSQPVTSVARFAEDSTVLAHMQAEWDYSATERWGWIILITTWICFVVVMGSCLGIWSWAWDVGETPAATPELENDPTLPIIGYYPALMVLTAVMSWVWVFIAWLGVKYFKHARIHGDDS